MLVFGSCLSIDVEGRSGGMAMLWWEGSHFRLVNYLRSFINIIMEDAERMEVNMLLWLSTMQPLKRGM